VLQVADDPVGPEPAQSRDRQELRRHVHEPVTTQSNSRPANASRIESASPTSAVSGVTSWGSGRRAAERPRLMTETSIPWRTDSATQDALMVPVPPMWRTFMPRIPIRWERPGRSLDGTSSYGRRHSVVKNSTAPCECGPAGALADGETGTGHPRPESACAPRFGEFVVSRPFQDMIERGVPRLRALPAGPVGPGTHADPRHHRSRNCSPTRAAERRRASAGRNACSGSYLHGPKGPFQRPRRMLIFKSVARGVSRRQLSSGGFI
jgi:hypothetical protein